MSVLEPGDKGDSLALTLLSLVAGLGSSNCLSNSDFFFRLLSTDLDVCANGCLSINSRSFEPRGVAKTSLSLSLSGSGVMTLVRSEV